MGFSDQERIKNLTNNLLGGSGGLLISPEQRPENPLERMWTVIQQLDAGLMQVSAAEYGIAQALDVARLTIHMLSNIIVEAGLITKEKLGERYQEEVINKIKEVNDKAQKEYEQAVEEARKQQETQREQKPAEEPQSDVVLQSERAGGTIKFPSK